MITNLFSALLVLTTNTATPIYPHPDLCEVRADGINWCNGGASIHAWDNCQFFEGFFTTDFKGIPICVLPYLEEVPAEYLYFYHPDNCKQTLQTYSQGDREKCRDKCKDIDLECISGCD